MPSAAAPFTGSNMKAQTRRGTLIETGVNLVVGFVLTWCANRWILPWWGFHPPAAFLWTIGGVMTVISIARQYTLRRIFEWLRIRKAPPEFLEIAEERAAERHRQISGEGYSLAHDDTLTGRELARAAGVYALYAALEPEWRRGNLGSATQMWPFKDATFRPTNDRRDLIKAGSMIIAEIGRLDRAMRRSWTGK